MRVCGVLAKSEVPSADEMQDSVQALQFMLDLWGADNLMAWGLVQETFTLTANQQSYTIGASASLDFNTAYPYSITDAYLRDGANVDTGIDIITRDEYNAYSDKIVTASRPEALYYDHGVASQTTPTGTIFLYPMPDGSSTYQLILTSQKPLAAILTSTATFELLAPYEEAIKYNLAIRLWPEFHENPKDPIPQHIVVLAKEAKRVIERNSLEMDIVGISIPGARLGLWNILSDTSVENR